MVQLNKSKPHPQPVLNQQIPIIQLFLNLKHQRKPLKMPVQQLLRQQSSRNASNTSNNPAAAVIFSILNSTV